VSLNDVEIGDMIKAPDGYVEVKDKFDHGIQDLFQLTLEDGKTIRCTILHKFLCTDGCVWPLWKIISSEKEIVSE